MKLKFRLFVFLIVIFPTIGYTQKGSDKLTSKDYQVAVYYFPNYHPDSINDRWHGKGWTEWEVVKAAKPRFEGHEQPKVPDWVTLMKQILNGLQKKLIWLQIMELIVLFMIGTGIQIRDSICRRDWKKDF